MWSEAARVLRRLLLSTPRGVAWDNRSRGGNLLSITDDVDGWCHLDVTADRLGQPYIPCCQAG